LRSRSKLTVLGLITLLLTILVGEAMLGVLAATIPTVDALLSRTPIQAAVADERLGWRGNPAYPGHDRLGYRNREVPAEAEIVAMGDSQTYGVGVEREEAWPQQLERLSGRRTYNMGFSGWGPLQSLMVFDEGLAVHPRIVIAALYAGNDLADSFATVYRRGQFPDLRASQDRTLAALAEADRADPWIKKMNSPVDLDPKDKGRKPPRTPLEFAVQNSRIIGLALAVQQAFQRAPTAADEIITSQPDENHPAFDNGRVRTLFSPNYRLAALDLADPRIVEGERISLLALQRLREQSEARGIQFVVLLLPTKELVFKSVVSGTPLGASRAYSALVANEEMFWQRMRAALADQGIASIDTLPTLRDQLERGPAPYPETTDAHPNAIGQGVIAELVLAELQRLELLR
jgi:GDSL-like lipase/acylhydrolase family protein